MRVLVGAYPRWIGSVPSANQRIYFANHTSHMDTLVLWAALPHALRVNTRPVAARDYWGTGGIRQQIAQHELNVVMIDRARENPEADPLEPLHEALALGFSLIFFPEGTRSGDPEPGEFKAGVALLATGCDIPVVPCHLAGTDGALPKGAWFPRPRPVRLTIGAPRVYAHLSATKESRTRICRELREAVISLGQVP